MKRIYLYLVAAMTIASAASCTEQISDTKRPAELGTMTISASMGTVSKTVYDNQNVLWEGDEQITVFSLGETVVDEAFEMSDCSQDKTKAQFTGIADLAADRYLAVYPHSAENSCTPEGTVSVSIPAVQTAVAGGFASGANVAVATFAKGDADVTFKNVSALIAFEFDTEDEAKNTKKVTFKVKNSDSEFLGIAGNVAVSFNSDGEPLVSGGDAYQVDLNAPVEGFETGVVYYVPVCPIGDFSGLQISYTAKDDYVFDKTNDVAGELTRNQLLNVGAVPNPYGGFPNDFQIILDFSKGVTPFIEDILEQSAQQKNTDLQDKYTYVYKYSFGETEITHNISFYIARGCDGDSYYKLENDRLYFVNDRGDLAIRNTSVGMMRCSGVDDRYITNIGIEFNATTKQTFTLQCGTFVYNGTVQIDGVSATYSFNSSTSPATVELPVTNVPAILGQSYDIRMRTTNGAEVTKLNITYSKTKPE